MLNEKVDDEPRQLVGYAATAAGNLDKSVWPRYEISGCLGSEPADLRVVIAPDVEGGHERPVPAGVCRACTQVSEPAA